MSPRLQYNNMPCKSVWMYRLLTPSQRKVYNPHCQCRLARQKGGMKLRQCYQDRNAQRILLGRQISLLSWVVKPMVGICTITSWFTTTYKLSWVSNVLLVELAVGKFKKFPVFCPSNGHTGMFWTRDEVRLPCGYFPSHLEDLKEVVCHSSQQLFVWL